MGIMTFDGGKSRYDFGSWRSLHKSTSSASGVGGWACAFELSRWQLEFHGVDECEKNKHGHRTRYHVGQLDQLSSIRSGDAQEIDETYQVLESLEWSAAISWICRLCYGRSTTHGDLVELGSALEFGLVGAIRKKHR
ncbi:hypothetical protein RHGRI_030934 [Rhododendron griersonianum]|uniref:Uncharacterized protein n=1 Tax=Rhododendron griersonianum TaxID=479676 RepID=A0AAV6I5X7_9ERIC|nr:hypothetical protein RHGRI_030934 [Rhododendron griersonianum]